jgi:hypothetical protein
VYTNVGNSYGQTFTTGSNAGGYTLTDIFLEVSHNYQNNNGDLGIPFTIENSTATAKIAPTESVTLITGDPALQSDGAFSNHWIEYIFSTPVTLAANTQYSLVGGAQTQTDGGTVNFAGTGNDGYAGGAVFDPAGSVAAGGNGVTGLGVADLVFDIGLTATTAPVPEPSTWALMIGGLGMLVIYQRRRSKLNL